MAWIVINDVDGDVLHEGEAPTRKVLIQRLVGEGKPFARADLRDADLKNLDLSKGDFEAADLTGAKMRGTLADRACFRDAIMRGVVAPGFTARRADFTGADFRPHPETDEPSILAGCEFSYSVLDGAKLDRADFSDSGLSSITLVGARGTKIDFSGSSFHNVDWTLSVFLGCDFTDADLTPTIKADARHLPDRTRGATIVGNTLKGVKIGPGHLQFGIDARVGRATEVASFAAVAAGAFLAGTYLPFDGGEDLMRQVFGQGVGFVAVACAASVLTDKIGDGIKDRASAMIRTADRKAREAILKLVRAGASVASLAVAYATSDHVRVLKDGLRAPGGGFVKSLGRACGGVHVMVCDRGSLARALTHLSDALDGRGGRTRDMLIVRRGDGPAEVPRAVLLRPDDGFTAYWDAPWGGPASATWTPEGRLEGSSGYMTGLGQWGNPRRCVRAFMREALGSAGIEDPMFDLETHRIKDGLDGSIVVVRKSDSRLDNPHGPAIVTPLGERLEYRNGGRRDDPEPDAPSITRA